MSRESSGRFRIRLASPSAAPTKLCSNFYSMGTPVESISRAPTKSVDASIAENIQSTDSQDDNNSIIHDASVSNTTLTSSPWHDERLQKSMTHSNTFQKRLEEQAAAAIQKVEQKTIHEYEKKLSNTLSSLAAIEKRKNNDLRLIELRKKTEMDKIAERLTKELYEEEKWALKAEQESLKNQFLDVKQQNYELKNQCREIAEHNKRLLAEIANNKKIKQECEQYNNFVVQLESIRQVFKAAHTEAVEDIKYLEEDCKKESKEKMKTKRWLESLISMMEQRCQEPQLLKKLKKIELHAREKRGNLLNVRRNKRKFKRRNPDKKSRRNMVDEGSRQDSYHSETTTALFEKVQDMRKQTKAQQHILEDRYRIPNSLLRRKPQEDRHEQNTCCGRREEKKLSRQGDDETIGFAIKEKLKSNRRLDKKVDERRKEIEMIVNEMRKLDVKDGDVDDDVGDTTGVYNIPHSSI